MSDDEGRLIIDDPNSPDNGGLIIADDSPKKGYLNMLKEMEPSGVTIGSSSRKKVFDPDLTPPYMNGQMKQRIEETIEDGEIAEDDELTPEEQMKQMMANQQSSYRTPSSVKSPTRSSRESRESRDGRDERREPRSNGSNGDGHSSSSSGSRSASSHAHSHSTSHSHPHSRGAPGGVRSKPDPLSTPHSHAPAGHLRKSIDSERDRDRKDRHHSIHSSIHSLHSSISSSTASGGSASTHSSSSSSSLHPSIPPLMALDVPSAVPSPALTQMIERGERRDIKENGGDRGDSRRERNPSISSSTSSTHKEKDDEKRDLTPLNGISDSRRKRASILPSNGEEKDGVEPPEKRRKQREENRDDDEELEGDKERKTKSCSPASFSSRGTSVGVQAEREDSVLNLPAGSSITLTFTVVCRSEQANNDLNNTLYLSTMIGGREMMCVLTDSEILGMRRRSLASSSSSEDSGNRNGTPSKSFRGIGTPRDKRARNGMERKRRVMAENDEEDDSSGGGEGTSGLNLQRIELVEKASKREMHHCNAEGCEFRFSRSSELEYHKEEMHRKKKRMMEDLACQTVVSSFLPRSTMGCQTDTVIVLTNEENEERKKANQKTVKTEPKVEEQEDRMKDNGAPALTIQTGAGPSSSSSTPSSTGATVAGGTLLMKASPSIPKENAATHTIHHPIAMAPPSSMNSSSSSTMPTLTPAISTPSTPSSSSKSSRHPAGGASVPSPHPGPLVGNPQSLMMGVAPLTPLNPHPPGTAAHTHYQQQLLQMNPHYVAMQQMSAAAASQHKGGGGGTTTQHKINELKVKQEENGPSTSSGIAAHHPSMAKVSTASAVQSPAANQRQQQQQQQQQQQMHPQMMYPMMGMVQPNPQQQMMMQQQMMQHAMLSHLMNGTNPAGPPPRGQPPQNMQMMPAMTPADQMMLMQQMMMMPPPQQK